jgi:spore cortex biosynthesis protein YabQ
MNHEITVELQFFCWSIIWGAIILISYDVLRIIRRLINHNSFILAVEDLIFWVATSVFIFAMMYRENNGIIRGFAVMGMGIGMFLYHYILSELLVKLITSFIHTLFRPFAIALRQVKRFIGFVVSKGKKGIKYLLFQLKKLRKSVRITLSARKQKKAVKRK